MTSRPWIRRLFACPPRTVRMAPARCRLAVEGLENRLAPAVQLTYSGPGSVLNLQELVSGATPTVRVSEPTPGQLRIDLGALTFDATSTATAAGLTYENVGVPAKSNFATLDISQANNISDLQATLSGDALTLGTIANAAGGLGSVTVSAAVIAVNGLDTSAANGNVDLGAAWGLTVADQALLDTGTGTLSLASGVDEDGTGNGNSNPIGGLPVVQDFGFEQPNVGSGANAVQVNPSGTPWTYSGGGQDGSGVSGNGSIVTANNPNAPQGNQVAFLPQQQSISQTINFAAGTYSVNFLAAQMGHFNGSSTSQTFQVEVDGVVVGTFAPTYTSYLSFTTDTFAVTAGNHTISFVGTNDKSGTNIALIDAVSIGGVVSTSGILAIASGATVVSDNAGGNAITLRGADIDIDTSGAPVTVGGHPISIGGTPTGALIGQDLHTPSAVAFDDDGNVYVADPYANAVFKFAPGGSTPIATFTAGLNGPNALAFNYGDLYVANYGPGGTGTTVSVFLPDGTPVRTFTGLAGPSALAFDEDFNVYVANTTGNTVSKFRLDGTLVATLTDVNLKGPTALAFGADGNLYVANALGGSVSVFAPNTTTPLRTFIVAPIVGTGPNAIAFDADGNLYVANANIVSVYPPGSTTPDLTRTLTGLNGPGALAFDAPRGNLFVANDETVSVFAPGSITPTATLTGLISPLNLAFDADGNLFVSNYNAVSVFSLKPASGGVVVRPAQPDQTIGVGLTSDTGLTLNSAELARIFTAASGTLTFGDSSQTGDITFATATLAMTPGASVVAVQAPTGPGAIVLELTAGPALAAGTADIRLSAGSGGIVATVGYNNHLASTGRVTLDTAGGIGTSDIPIGFDAAATPSAVVVGATIAPAEGVYLGGLGALTLGNVRTVNAPLDAFAEADLTVAAGSLLTTGTGTIALAAGVFASGIYTFGGGVLAIENGATVVTDNASSSAITLRGTDIDIAAGDNPAVVGAQRSSGLSPTPSFTFTGLSQPTAVAVGPDGTLYVANGTVVSVFAPGSTTFTNLTGVSFPQALALDAAGNLYVANTGPSGGPPGTTVSVFAKDGTPQAPLTGLSGPSALVFDAAGNLYVLNSQGTTVSVFGPDGSPQAPLTGLSFPGALAIGPDGSLFVANGDGTVHVFNPGSTTADRIISGPRAPLALAVDAAGNLYVADAAVNTVSKFDTNGTLTDTFTGLNVPVALAIDALSNLFVANYNGNTVSVFATDGTVTTLTGTATAPLNAPRSLAFDRSGNLYVANSGGTAVSVFSAPPPNPTAGGVVVRTAQPAQPIRVGAGTGAGLALSNAELAQVFTTASGMLTFGDSSHTGAITFAAATPATSPGASVAALQSPTSPGAIVLDSSAGTALVVGPGNIQLSAGTGGIVVTNGSATASLASTGQVTLDTPGGIGASGGRLLFDATATPAAVAVGAANAPSAGVYLGGLGNLTLAGVRTVNASLDVTATANLTVARNALVTTGTGTIALAAGVNPDGTGSSSGRGMLAIASGATVVSENAGSSALTLRGTDIDIDTSAAPAVVGAHRSAVSTTATSTLTGLSGPSALAFDADAKLYVANTAGNTVSVFAPDGTATTLNGTAGVPLNGPSALAFDADGNLYVANFNGNTVSRYAPDGTLTGLRGLNGPQALAVDAAGNLYVANFGGTTVSVFAPNGSPQAPLTGLSGPSALAFDAHGNLFVANSSGNTVSVFAKDGSPQASLTGLSNPRALAFDARGNLFVANFNGNTVSVFGLAYDAHGNLLSGGATPKSPLTGLSGPRALTFDARGNLFVANAGSGGTGTTVSVFAPNSTTPSATLSGLRGPNALAIDDGGNLFVANGGNSTVSVFAPRPAAGGVVVRTSQPVQAIRIGAGTGTGLALSNAELAQVFTSAPGTLTFGDATQTGTITFAASTPSSTPGANIVAVQSPTGPGAIVLDSTAGTALDAGPSAVRLSAGAGGIVSTGGSANPSIASSGQVALDTPGGIGASTGRVLFDATHTPTSVVVGRTTAPGGVYLGGLGRLTLGDVQTANATLDVTAAGDLIVARFVLVATGTGTINLAAGVNPDGTGSGGGVLAITAGATVVSDNAGGNAITLRGTDIDIDTSAAPAVVGGHRSAISTTPSGTRSGLSAPGALAFDAGGNLFVVNGNSVSKFAPDGSLLTTLSGGLNRPTALGFDAHGNLFVVNEGSGTVSVFAPDGSSQGPLTGLNVPFALAFDGDGNLLVTNFADGTVTRFVPAYDAGGKLLPGSTTQSTAFTGLNVPIALAFDAVGNLYVVNAGNGTVSVFAPDGTPKAPLTGLTNPIDLVFDAHGNLFVADVTANAVYVFAPGSTTPTATLTGLDGPAALAFDAVGNLFVGNAGFNDTGTTVSKFTLAYDAHGNLLPGNITPSATLTGTALAPLAGPAALAVDAAGNLFVANFGGTTVSVFAVPPPTPAAGGVVIGTVQADQPISLGAASGTGLALSDAEMAQFFSTGAVTVGDPFYTGDITVTGNVTSHPGYDTLSLRTQQQGSINTAAGATVTVANLALQAGSGIGTTGAMAIDATHLAFASQSGPIRLTDANAVTLTRVDTLLHSSIPGDVFSAPAVGDFDTLLSSKGGVSGQVTYQGQGLAQGATLTLSDSHLYRISYQANGGQDVTLTRVANLANPGPLPPGPPGPAPVPPRSHEQRFVSALYRAVLGREADAAGLAAWVSFLRAGGTRLQVARGVWASPEHRGRQVDRFYATYLDRTPDAAGRAAWVNALLRGRSEADVAAGLLTSGEYRRAHAGTTAYLAGLYADVLGRTPAPGELANWQRAARGVGSRQALAAAFLRSAEAGQQFLGHCYAAYLGRGPDAAGMAAWLAVLRGGRLSAAQVAQAFLASVEFHDRAVR